jgi:hypothetical protein
MFYVSIHVDNESLIFGFSIPSTESKELPAEDRKPTLYCVRTLSYISIIRVKT